MVFSPAWGGLIPTVPIGSFQDFLQNRPKVREWFTGTITRAAVTKALRTKAGQEVAANVGSLMRTLGFKAPPGAIAIELQGYIAFQKFQHQQAVSKRNRAAQKEIEKIMALPDKFPKTGTQPNTFPVQYFDFLVAPKGGPTKTKEDEDRRKAFHSWLERRKFRRGRFVNVDRR